jgi:hypothetical protein
MTEIVHFNINRLVINEMHHKCSLNVKGKLKG